MNAFKTIDLMSKYSDCPNCGNSLIGNGEGKLIVEDDTFTRECKCGFKITLDRNGEVMLASVCPEERGMGGPPCSDR
jgi:iron(III) transport system ATP-binding protein